MALKAPRRTNQAPLGAHTLCPRKKSFAGQRPAPLGHVSHWSVVVGQVPTCRYKSWGDFFRNLTLCAALALVPTHGLKTSPLEPKPGQYRDILTLKTAGLSRSKLFHASTTS
jgi:hypothetical protein